MKIRFGKRNVGGIFLVLLLLVLFIIIVGLAVYNILKAIERFRRPPEPDEVRIDAPYMQGLLTDWFEDTYPESNVVVLIGNSQEVTQTNYWPDVTQGGFVPFANLDPLPGAYNRAIERSTNLVYWETIAVIYSDGPPYMDTNPPPNQAFYRMRDWIP